VAQVKKNSDAKYKLEAVFSKLSKKFQAKAKAKAGGAKPEAGGAASKGKEAKAATKKAGGKSTEAEAEAKASNEEEAKTEEVQSGGEEAKVEAKEAGGEEAKAEAEEAEGEEAKLEAEEGKGKSAEPEGVDSEGKALRKTDKVRLTVEDLMTKLRYGDEGRVVGAKSEGAVAVLFDKSFAEVTVLSKLLSKEPEGGWCKQLPLTGFVRQSMNTKVAVLREACIVDPHEQLLEEPDKDWLCDQAMDVFSATVRLNLNILEDTACVWVHTCLVRYLLEDFLKKGVHDDYNEATEARKQKRVRVLRHLWSQARMMLVPIFSCEGVKHWTLLVLRKCEDEVKVSYFDSLHKVHEGGLKSAQILLKVLFEDKAPEIPIRSNTARQSSAECGWFVLHYLEVHLRFFRGEGFATVSWPDATRMKAMRSMLAGWTKTLEGTRQRWAEDVTKEQLEEAAKRTKLAKIAEERMKAKGHLEALVEARKTLAALLITTGAASKAPPLPEGFGAKPLKDKAEEKTAKAEAKGSGGALKKAEAKAEESGGAGKKAEAEGSGGAEKKAEAEVEGSGGLEKKAEAEAGGCGGAEKKLEAEAEGSGGAEKKAEAEAKESGGAKKAEAKAKTAHKGFSKEALQLGEADEFTIQFAVDHMEVADLRDEYRKAYEKVKAEGLGVCSKCRCFQM